MKTDQPLDQNSVDIAVKRLKGQFTDIAIGKLKASQKDFAALMLTSLLTIQLILTKKASGHPLPAKSRDDNEIRKLCRKVIKSQGEVSCEALEAYGYFKDGVWRESCPFCGGTRKGSSPVIHTSNKLWPVEIAGQPYPQRSAKQKS